MPELIVKFEVFCTCGNGLCQQTSDISQSKRGLAIEVDACPLCLKKSKEEGYKEWREEGYEKGFADAKAEGEQTPDSKEES